MYPKKIGNWNVEGICRMGYELPTLPYWELKQLYRLHIHVLPLRSEIGHFSQKKVEESICDICNKILKMNDTLFLNPEYDRLRIELYSHVSRSATLMILAGLQCCAQNKTVSGLHYIHIQRCGIILELRL